MIPSALSRRALVIAAAGLLTALTTPGARAEAGPSTNAPASTPPAKVILVVGAPGEAEFAPLFTRQVESWKEATRDAGGEVRVIGESGPPEEDRTQLQAVLEAEATAPGSELWVVLIGHGTFDGREARFNLRGPDVTPADLAGWLKAARRPLALINTASASAPFLPALSGTNRVVITATRSGNEKNFARFGQYLAESIRNPSADLDQDGQTSLLEAFLSAGAQVNEFYRNEGRLATEHALLDDNGDGLGTPADWFRGLRATRRPKDKSAVDGLRAHQWHLVRSAAENLLTMEQRARRDALERQIAELRDRRQGDGDDAYYAELERLLLQIAQLYRELPTAQAADR